MTDYGRRIVVDSGFEAVLGDLSRVIREEGLQTIARIDVRDHFWRDAGRDFRHYFLIEAWSADLAFEALQHDLAIGTILPTTFAVYELPDGETAVVVQEPLAPLASDLEWRKDAPALASLADREAERVATVLARLRRASSPQVSSASAG